MTATGGEALPGVVYFGGTNEPPVLQRVLTEIRHLQLVSAMGRSLWKACCL